MRTCSVVGCDKPHKGHSLCHTHLTRFRKTGSTDKRILPPRIKHGGSRTVEYAIWARMKHRCKSSKSQDWNNYGGRGIKVCKRWETFENFIQDMGNRPSPKHSIDRINVNGNYEPNNCRWATQLEQANNTRTNHTFIINGKKTTMAEIARAIGMNYGTFRDRIYAGYSIIDAMEQPVTDCKFKPKESRRPA